ncbi:hypothetical protein [Streptomyces sp. NPDC005494]
MPAVAVVVSTPQSLCLQRQKPRTANRRVPGDVVRAQHQAMTYSQQPVRRRVHRDRLCLPPGPPRAATEPALASQGG